MSGFPAKSLLCNRNRKPNLCRSLRTEISVDVLRLLTRRMISDRFSGVNLSEFAFFGPLEYRIPLKGQAYQIRAKKEKKKRI
jgi:hypothetical protein